MIIKGQLAPSVGRVICYKNQTLTILPWNLSSYFLASRLGVAALPNPSVAYDFSSFSYLPYDHQIQTIDFLLKNPRAFCWNEAGTGKTASCVWASDILFKDKIISKMLVICPLSTCQAVWGSDLTQMLPKRPHAVLTGTRQKRIKLLQKNLGVYIINHDGIKALSPELLAWAPDLVIVDEHTGFKNKSSQRWRALNKLCLKSRNVWMLSGTPAPQAPTDLFALGRIICPELVGRSKLRFQAQLMIQVSMYKWVVKPNFEDTLKQLIQPVIRFARDECLDLPNVVQQTFRVNMSKKQQLTFNELRKDALVQIDSGLITAVHEGVMRNKLLQCCAGYVYATESFGEEGEKKEKQTIVLNPKERLDTLRDLINESPRGVLVFIHYRSAISAVASFLEPDFSLRVIHGGTSLNDRTANFKAFQQGKIKVLIAHPRTMGHGVTLTYADTVIWYLVTSDAEIYEQANARIERIGQEHKMRVIHLVSTSLEDKILARLQEKRSMQGVLLEALGKK